MHPIVVLSALALAEHFIGVQGLFLAIPVTLYLITEVLYERKEKGFRDSQPDHVVGPSATS